MPDKYNNSFIVSRLSGFLLSLSAEAALKIIRKEIKRLCVSQKHIGRDSPEEISGPYGVLKYRDISVGFVPKDETTSDAADGAADP